MLQSLFSPSRLLKPLSSGLFGVLALLLVNPQEACGQYNTLSELYIGPRAGANLSTVTLVPRSVDLSFAMGKEGGLTIRYISEKHFGFQIDASLSEAGWQEIEDGDYDDDGIYLERFYQRTLKMIDVPFMMHAFTTAGAARFFLNVGPRFTYVFGEQEYNVSPYTLTEFGKRVENPFQYGILGGGGFEVHMGPCVLGLEGRYTYFLSNLFKDAVGEDFVTSDLQTISVNAYLLFQLSGNRKK